MKIDDWKKLTDDAMKVMGFEPKDIYTHYPKHMLAWGYRNEDKPDGPTAFLTAYIEDVEKTSNALALASVRAYNAVLTWHENMRTGFRDGA
jgi:hypothetical protein